eukprot:TRINITY_DN66230_c0_g1_i1.p1 TRINITY_DN66230_c0_g1~~TRINITY_DN66230_c0_g1_i1.p1  ORF type:complete len:202 (+),score=9.31 TRINITY_DN66230_c0_g1_i1:89-694(+)
MCNCARCCFLLACIPAAAYRLRVRQGPNATKTEECYHVYYLFYGTSGTQYYLLFSEKDIFQEFFLWDDDTYRYDHLVLRPHENAYYLGLKQSSTQCLALDTIAPSLPKQILLTPAKYKWVENTNKQDCLLLHPMSKDTSNGPRKVNSLYVDISNETHKETYKLASFDCKRKFECAALSTLDDAEDGLILEGVDCTTGDKLV